MRTRISRILTAGIVALASTFPVSCSSRGDGTSSGGPEASGASAGRWPREIKHEKGTTELKSRPKRIVSTSPSVTGSLLAIDAPLVATAATTPSPITDSKGFFSQWAKVADRRGVKSLYGNLQFNMEAIVAAEPDLVVVSSSGADSVADHYAEISARFPTVVVDYSKQDWRKLSVQLGDATGLESKAKKVTADFDQYVRDAKAKIKPPDGDVSIVSFNGAGGQNQAVGKREGPHAKLLEAMGFTVVDAPPGLETRRQKRSDFAFVTYENLAKAIKGKSIFLISASDKTVAGFLADPLLANLPAVQSKRVHSLGPTSFRIDYYSGRQIVDAVVKSFS